MHECWECQRGELDFPCRVDGRTEPRVVAAAFVAQIKLDGRTEPEPCWPFECFLATNQHNPEVCWEIICEAVPLLKSSAQAATFPAGVSEDFVKGHLPAFLDRIEALAKASPRFRFVLSGIWAPADAEENPLWQRFERARAPGPWIDDGDPLPPL